MSWEHNDGKATIDVIATMDGWNVGGIIYNDGDKLTIRASTLADHVKNGRCVPADKYAAFQKIRAAQAAAAEESRRIVAEATADAEKAESKMVEDALKKTDKDEKKTDDKTSGSDAKK